MPDKKTRKKKYTFVLKGVDMDEIDRVYQINVDSNLQDFQQNKNVTKINNLSSISHEEKYYSYLDESKKQHLCVVSMIDLLGKPLPEKSNHNCFWCRSKFSSQPIGCPIRYVPCEIVKTYFSEITKEDYTIRQNISKLQSQKIIQQDIDEHIKLDIINKDFYITDGVFCSFNCCLAYINNNSHNYMYTKSKNLLNQIYEQCFKCNSNIKPAPHWRLLKDYGGKLSIEDFRDNFYKISYESEDNYLAEMPECKPIGYMYNEKIRM